MEEAISFPKPSSPSRATRSRKADEGEQEATNEANEKRAAVDLPLRSFPGQCAKVLTAQAPLKAFDPHEVFAACSFFQVCSTYFIRELVEACGLSAWDGQTLGLGHTVYSEGDTGASMYVIASGEASAFTGGGTPSALGVGDFFGEAQMLGMMPNRRETVWAKRPLRLLEVTSSAFTKLLQHRSTAMTKEASEEGPETWCYTFALERRHFEQLSARLHRPSAKGQQGTPRAAALSPRLLDISQHHLESELQRVRHERASLQEADPCVQHILDTSQQLIQARLERVKQDRKSSCSPARRRRPSASGFSSDDEAGRMSPTSSVPSIRGGIRRPRQKVGSSEDPSQQAPLASGVSGLENPKLWREVRDRMQKVLLSGDMPVPACEKVQQRLADSIRDDLVKGYVVPASVARRARSSFNVSQAAWSEKRRQKDGSRAEKRPQKDGRASKDQTRKAPEAAKAQEGDCTQPGQLRRLVASFSDSKDVENHLLSLQLLPSIGLMSVEQKHSLLDDLEQVMKRQGNRRFKSAVLGLQRASRLLQKDGLVVDAAA